MNQPTTDHLEAWNTKQALAEQMIPLIGQLYRDHDIVMSVHGRSLIGRSAIDIIRAHGYARKIDDTELSLAETSAIVEALTAIQPGPVSLDLALLANDFRNSGATDLESYLRDELAPALSAQPASGRDVVLYGFGRIGRLLARIMIEHAGSQNGLNLRAIVVRKNGEKDLIKRANLLRRDSVHGPFNGIIKVLEDENVILANGVRIQVIYSNDPADVDYTSYGIEDAILVDNTGRWRDAEGLSQHLENTGISRVVLTAPGKGDLLNVVYGVNNDKITDADTILSAASCTTNAITPVLKVMNDTFGVKHGHVETVHSYTNDQNLIDNFHSGDRRGRSAALNMVLTETGAAKAVAKALPEFEGKLTGNAIRVPTPNVSMAVLNLQLEKETSAEELNALLEQVSLTGHLRTQIDFVESPEIVSTDFVGSNRAGIVDGLATIVTGSSAVLYVWYDNEYGYSCQVVRIIEQLAGAILCNFPSSPSSLKQYTHQNRKELAMSEKYLIGVDGSEHSRAALKWGLNRAADRGAAVELIHVADDSFLSESVAFLSEAQAASEQMLAHEIERARTELGFTGEITGTAVVGHPIAEVEAASKHADLLVLGAHSGGKFAGSVFGTRAVKVAAVAHCPVAVIPAEQGSTGSGVVVGVDGSDASKRAIGFAAEEASFRGVPLIAVYAWMPPLTPGLEYLWSEELVTAQQSAAEESIAIGTAGLAERYPDLEVRREIVQAPPVTALLQVAETAEMVVVGSRGRGGISRLLLGSVSHGVLNSLPCTTVVTRAE